MWPFNQTTEKEKKLIDLLNEEKEPIKYEYVSMFYGEYLPTSKEEVGNNQVFYELSTNSLYIFKLEKQKWIKLSK